MQCWYGHNIDMKCEFTLIDNSVTKDECLGIIWQEGIKMPEMYKLGYSHNNCVGCVKGGNGYCDCEEGFKGIYIFFNSYINLIL